MNLDEALALIRTLQDENAQLRQRLAFLEYVPMLAAGLHGEQLVAKAVDGTVTTFTASADVSVDKNDLLLEVKFSTLNVANKGRTNSTTRWTWPKPLGYRGSKRFDRLILIGPADLRYRTEYLDNEPYVFFDVPFSEVQTLTVLGGTHRNIQISTNPKTAKTAPAVRLFRDYMLPFAELNARYGLVREPHAPVTN